MNYDKENLALFLWMTIVKFHLKHLNEFYTYTLPSINRHALLSIVSCYSCAEFLCHKLCHNSFSFCLLLDDTTVFSKVYKNLLNLFVMSWDDRIG